MTPTPQDSGRCGGRATPTGPTKDADNGKGGEPLRYHPDPVIAAEVAADALTAEITDLSLGWPPRAWSCPSCAATHRRGHFGAFGVHRCLGCGYVGTGGVMFDTKPRRVTTSSDAADA